MSVPEFDAYYEPGMERPYPRIPAQGAIGMTRMYEDETGEVVTECIVTPNLILFFYPAANPGFYLGQSRMCSPQYARQLVAGLAEVVEHVNACECSEHAGRSMEQLDPDVELA
jgi:hypothetical protein